MIWGLAIVTFALKMWKHYICDENFGIYTDFKNLKYINCTRRVKYGIKEINEIT